MAALSSNSKTGNTMEHEMSDCCKIADNIVDVNVPRCVTTMEIEYRDDVDEDDFHFYYHLTFSYCKCCGLIVKPMAATPY